MINFYKGLLLVMLIGGAILTTLKLTGVVDWSWWMVLSPFWIPMAALASSMILGASVIGAMEITHRGNHQ